MIFHMPNLFKKASSDLSVMALLQTGTINMTINVLLRYDPTETFKRVKKELATMAGFYRP